MKNLFHPDSDPHPRALLYSFPRTSAASSGAPSGTPWAHLRVLIRVAVRVRLGACVRVHPGACLRVRRGYSPGPHRVHLRVFSGVVASGVSGYVRGCASGCIAGVSQGAPSGIRRVRCRVLVGYVFGCSPGSSSGRLAGTLRVWVRGSPRVRLRVPVGFVQSVFEELGGVHPESVAGGSSGSESPRKRNGLLCSRIECDTSPQKNLGCFVHAR